MSDIVEAVARAVHAVGYQHPENAKAVWETILPESVKDKWRADARAAIEAMRTPDAVMISAGDASLPFTRGTETHRMAGGITPEGIWDAMIEAALCDHDWQENTEDEDMCSKCDASREPATTNKG